MTKGELLRKIEHLPDNTEIFVGCQGYSNHNFSVGDYYTDEDTFCIEHNGKLFICDSCAIETRNGTMVLTEECEG